MARKIEGCRNCQHFRPAQNDTYRGTCQIMDDNNGLYVSDGIRYTGRVFVSVDDTCRVWTGSNRKGYRSRVNHERVKE